MSINDIVTSYLHMLVNRVFKSNQRKAELVIYDFLCQYYTTKFILSKEIAVV
jgi:hypothetical protein